MVNCKETVAEQLFCYHRLMTSRLLSRLLTIFIAINYFAKNNFSANPPHTHGSKPPLLTGTSLRAGHRQLPYKTIGELLRLSRKSFQYTQRQTVKNSRCRRSNCTSDPHRKTI